MAGIGLGMAWLGYWTLYYGVTQIQGMNYGFLDLGLPSKWVVAAKNPPRQDSGASSTASSGATAVIGGIGSTVAGAVIGKPNSALVPGLGLPGGTKLISPVGKNVGNALNGILKFLNL